MRKIQFVNGEYYHIYNRGIEKMPIFRDEKDYLKFKRGLKDFNNTSYYEERAAMVREYGFKELSSFLEKAERVVEIVAYCLIPNHFHLILKQLMTGGIPKFLHKIGTSFTNFINKKYDRSGSLFQGPYKAIHIDNNDYLLWLSGYVNGNAEIHGIAEAEKYQWSSYGSFLGVKEDELITDKEIILRQFSELKLKELSSLKERGEEYKKFVKVVIEESRKRKELEKYLLEKI